MKPIKEKFSPYQMLLIVLLTFIQFTVILDFMVLSPLGAILLEELNVSTGQFGMVVSAYAISAFASGVLSSGFADRFDRKKYLVFFYIGFLIGTALCAMANSFVTLLLARIVAGIFGGVISSISFAIVTDIFKVEMRGRVMGFLQMGLSASQILGLPIGLKLAEMYGWHSSFWMIVLTGIPVLFVLIKYMKPIDEHLKLGSKGNPFRHFINTLKNKDHLKAYSATILLATGGYMLMPFGSAFSTNNLGIAIEQLPLLYGITGVFTIIFGPVIGKLSDRAGRFKVFLIGTIVSMMMVLYYTQLGTTPFWICVAINVIMFMGITARIVSSQALISVIPEPKNRGAFMSVNSSIQQLSGGLSSFAAGQIIHQSSSGYLENYQYLGYVVAATMILASVMIFRLDKYIKLRKPYAPVVVPEVTPNIELKEELSV